jgi:hypothetical protein
MLFIELIELIELFYSWDKNKPLTSLNSLKSIKKRGESPPGSQARSQGTKWKPG